MNSCEKIDKILSFFIYINRWGDNMSKETFKKFVRVHPELVDYVNHKTMTWQQFYEIYDMYGENNEVWKKYQPEPQEKITTKATTALDELVSMVRNVDLETVQKGVDGLQKAIGLLQELGPNKEQKPLNSYEERPMYKYYED